MEPMPSWYPLLRDAVDDPRAPSEVKAAARGALEYVDQIRARVEVLTAALLTALYLGGDTTAEEDAAIRANARAALAAGQEKS
jgi:hypothetical protein